MELIGIAILASAHHAVVMPHHAGMTPERPWRMRKNRVCPGAIARAGHVKADIMFFCQARKLRNRDARFDFIAEVIDIFSTEPKHYRKFD
ncbi:MAG: hypothetical protein Q7J38_14775 [Gallionella sp.]|nr:hypothetical protein [Gallionella sp.]